jgi:hypothetical protein
MSILSIFIGIAVLVYGATNLGSDKKRPGHQGLGFGPMLYALAICGVVGVLLWPALAPLLNPIFAAFGIR